jgi:hypothetical protein
MARFCFLVLALILAGCSKSPEPITAPPVQLPDSATALTALTARVAALENQMQGIQVDKTFRELSDGKALFDPQDPKKYSSIKASAGTVLVVLESLEPYLDGFVVSFRFGNPGSAAYSGVKGTVYWGNKYDGSKDPAYNTLQSKSFEDTTLLEAGAWTIVKINIAPATAAQARRIMIEPHFDEVRLRGPIRM